MDNLSQFKCKNCGAELDLRKAVGGVVECEYCHTPWTVPKEETSPEALKYLHDGNAALDVCKFEDAYTYFQKAAEFDANEPEAYFGMALASFKVQYLKDEVNDCLQPICHEISEKAFTDDKNYKKALELASIEQKRVYRRKGGEIDEIRDEFFALERSGLRYDSFICVKVTEEDGRTHTEDYNRANDIYYYLKDNGYKPFYSEREMKGRTGSAYEALILYALYTSECMLIVCSDEGYLQTKWVKNEYTRFISLMQEGGKERDALTFVFTGKPIEKLPTGKKIQGIDILKPDAYSRITEYVESHTPEARRKREEEENRRKAEEDAQRQKVDDLQKQIDKLQKEKKSLEASDLSGEELLEAFEKAQAERKKQEEKAQLERKKQEEEERIKREEERKRYLAPFRIKNNILEKYCGTSSEVTIPEEITIIGKEAFGGDKNLTAIKIPESVKKICKGAFSGCTNLSDIEISDGVVEIEDGAFIDCSALSDIKIPSRLNKISEALFGRCIGLKRVIIPNGVKMIGLEAFYGCVNLEQVEIPDSVTLIEDGTFMDCRRLKNVRPGQRMMRIGNRMFKNCSSLTNIRLPVGIKEIGNLAFDGCSSLESIIIPDGTQVIGWNAFRRCGITRLTISDSVNSIGENAFVGCGNLFHVTIPKRFKGFLNSGLKQIFGEDEWERIHFTFI